MGNSNDDAWRELNGRDISSLSREELRELSTAAKELVAEQLDLSPDVFKQLSRSADLTGIYDSLTKSLGGVQYKDYIRPAVKFVRPEIPTYEPDHEFFEGIADGVAEKQREEEERFRSMQSLLRSLVEAQAATLKAQNDQLERLQAQDEVQGTQHRQAMRVAWISAATAVVAALVAGAGAVATWLTIGQ